MEGLVAECNVEEGNAKGCGQREERKKKKKKKNSSCKTSIQHLSNNNKISSKINSKAVARRLTQDQEVLRIRPPPKKRKINSLGLSRMSLCKLVMTHVIRVNLRHTRATRVATVNGGTPNFLGELVVYGSRLAKNGLFTVGRWSANGLTVYGVLYMTILRAKEREAADNLKNLSAKVDELKTKEQFNSEKLDALIFNVKPIGDDVKGIREDLKAVKDAVHKSSSSDS